MNFGGGDAKTSYEHCKNKKHAKVGKETFKTETLYC